MPEFNLSATPAIRATPLIGEGIALTARHDGAVVQVLGGRGDAGLRDRLAAYAREPYAVRALGPDQWLVVLSSALDQEGFARLEQVASDVGLVDQTHGRARIILEGARAREILAKGTAVDLHSSMFAEGSSAVTLVGHIGAQITRTGADRFELLVLRGFAQSLWDDLVQMSAECLN